MKQFLFLVLAVLSPSVAFAATVTSNNLEAIIAIIINLFNNYFNPILAAGALLAFLWGLAIFIWNSGNEKKRAEGKSIMLWGIIALFVMISILGLISLLQQTFGVGNTPIQAPSANSSDYNLGY